MSLNDSMPKTNLLEYGMKDANGEKIITSFYMNKNCWWVNYKLVIKIKVVLGLSNYAAIKELKHAKGVDISNLAKNILFFWQLKLTN